MLKDSSVYTSVISRGPVVVVVVEVVVIVVVEVVFDLSLRLQHNGDDSFKSHKYLIKFDD